MIRRRRRRGAVLVPIPADVVHRQMLYDGMQDVRVLGEIAGLQPISDEVDEMERADSQRRLDRISYLLPCILDQTQFMSELATMVQQREMEEHGIELTPTEVEHYGRAILAVVRSSVVNSVSTIVGLGLLEIPEVVREQQL